MPNPESTSISRQEAEALLSLADFLLDFAKVDRATYHQDGIRNETDSDHTVMLSVISCAFASKYAPHLDLGKISQFALIHDLVEGYAGDTPTMFIDEQGIQDKEHREQQALQRIIANFGDCYPWIHQTILQYETLDTPEARFVKTLDKCMPMITHIFNRGRMFGQQTFRQTQSDELFQSSTQAMIDTYASDQQPVIALRHQLRQLLNEACFSSDRSADSQK